MTALTTRLRAKLDEVSARHWLTSQLQQWIYDGARDACRKAECLRDSTTVTAVAGTQTYSLTATSIKDLVRINRVTYKQVGETEHYPLEYFDFNSVDSQSWVTAQQSRPQQYSTWGFPPSVSLVLYPAPPDAGTITVYYYRLPDSSVIATPANNVELPQGWEDLAIDYAVYQALLQDGDERWQAYKAMYDEHLSDLTVTAIRFNDQAGMMNVGSRGAVPRWLWDEGYV